ncbi:DUF1080 domain-containing protein [Pelagicoccus sp. SDUM812005]|uniref:3-keto-disaccharide hydrolase n=1 Tax=Pelagicoccus sp. SDUM812005 TaxID=3041257 RepID=UPI00280D0FB8|nr:DUF1080 domain-containing protein [Pelagicoccus sp. SDUM812005]MDQ8182038.1 DUF1080 domain-containing protein [Pelagicoccus sp. SDUM812005]
MYQYVKYSATAAIACLLAACSQTPSNQSVELFDGTSLEGWEGDAQYWSVKDGAIVAQTTPENPIPANSFLIWQGGTPADFELSLQFRITAQNDKDWANSGVQYRSRRLESPGYSMSGYQADIDLAARYIGMLYEEKGRGLLMKHGERIRITPKSADNPDPKKKADVEVLATETTREEILAAYRKNDWNELKIVTRGNHLQHFLNGTLTADVIDDDPSGAASEGLIGLQIHKGQPMTIEFKELHLTTFEN